MKGGTFSLLTARPCSKPRDQADDNGRSDGGRQAKAVRLARARAQQPAAAFVDGRTDQPGQRQQRADRQVDAAGQDHKGHADGQQP